MNGVDKSTKTIVLHEGDEIFVSGRVIEHDDSYPDITEFYDEGPFIISENTLQKDGFRITLTDITVKEYGGGNSGNEAIVNAVIEFEATEE